MAASGSDWNARKHDTSDLQPKRYGSYGRESSSGSSIGRVSFGLPGELHSHFNGGAENEHVSQLHDVEERALLQSRAHNLSVSHPLSVENVTENGAVSGQGRHSSVGRASSSGASLRRLFSLSSTPRSQLDEDVESEIVSQAGDIGDRALQHRAHNLNVSHPLSVENVTENGAVSGQVRHSYSERRASSSDASLRRLFSLPSAHCSQLDEDVESEIVSQAGDIGDRALSSRKGSLGESAHFPTEKGLVFPIPEELLESYGFWKHDPSNSLNNCPVSPLVEEIITPPSTDALMKKKQEEKKEKPPFEYLSCLVHLAVFGILGVLTRYLLQKLFGPGVAGVTKDQAILYLDLPANMVGSFLMGWFGVVFKADISSTSDQLLIGLSTGYLGSLTTFSSWNEKMVELSAKGRWVFAVTGVVIGLFLCAYSIIFGIETAKGFRWLLKKARKGSTTSTWSLTSKKHHLIALLSLLLIWAALLVTSAVLEHKDFKHGGSAAQLWLACLVGPLGVWIRWWLARLNGRGIGKAGWCKWIPFGTLYANVLAASVMAALATVKKAVNTKNCDTIATGIQFGLMGCLSTVSTFMAEFNAMRNSTHPWRAYAYATITIGMSFALGTLIYSVPVWAKNYK